MRSVTSTHFVNGSPAGSEPVTPRQLYKALKLKARDAREFVPMIERCEVLSENETSLLRVVYFKGDPNPVKERVDFFPPNIALFTRLSPTGEDLGHVTNIISTTPDGEVLLTFTFAIGPNGPEDVSAAAEEKAQVMLERANEAIKQTIVSTRILVKEGKV